MLGKELLSQLLGFFKEWLSKCPSNISTKEIIIIRNFGAVFSTMESNILQMEELKPSWIWYIFSQPGNINGLISLLQKCFASESPDVLFATSSAFKSYLGILDRKWLEIWLISVLDAILSIPGSQTKSIINMWNFGVLNVFHSYIIFPKYSLKNEEILGWSTDECILLGKEIMWNWSVKNNLLNDDTKSKVLLLSFTNR